MRYLIQNEEKAIIRDELLNTVWGYEYTGGSNVVDAAEKIGRLFRLHRNRIRRGL